MNESMAIEKTGRSCYWDNIKGVLILLVVFGHILLEQSADMGMAKTVLLYIYMFHMPAFVFVSGYFGKSERSHSFEAILKLIVLYFVFNSVMGFWRGFGSLLLLTPQYSYWYLLAMIAWRMSAHRIAKAKEIRVILFAVAVFIGFYPEINNTLAMMKILAFYPFYMAGYRTTAEKIDQLRSRGWSVKIAIGAAAVLLALAGMWASSRFLLINMSVCEMSPYVERIEAFSRIAIYIVSALAILALCCFSVDRKIPLLTTFGRNSLWIFLLHRPVTLMISNTFCRGMTVRVLLGAALLTLLIAIAFGNSLIVRPLNCVAEQASQLFSGGGFRRTFAAQLLVLVIACSYVAKIVIGAYNGVTWEDMKALLRGDQAPTTGDYESGDDPMYVAMSAQQKEAYDNAFRITFAGDLILLEDQVKRGWNGTGYDFSDVFEYAKPYIDSADYAIGVFEGPMAGEAAGYSSGNFADGKTLWLNFPDAFAAAVKEAGFDLVTTANNHLLDRGVDGAKRTLDVLDSIGLDHTGSYRSEDEKQRDRIKLVTVGGIRMAILAYTYGTNEDKEELVNGSLTYLSSVAYGTSGEEFEKCKKQVEEDFAAARAMNPDLIIVLPHMGAQFDNMASREQLVWFEIFKKCGADIVLGDHAHAVQPVSLDSYNGRNVLTAFCPGNFANIYREKQGDTSMLIDVYVDRETKEVIGGSIVPLYTQASLNGNYRALPIHEILTNSSLREQLSTDDLLRAKEANETVTKVVFKQPMDITTVTERYYFDENGYVRSKATGLEINEQMRNGVLFRKLEEAQTICFIGDSVTEGTRNGGCPWYEPIEEYLGGRTILNYSKGGCTVSYMTDHQGSIPQADLYVIALGTNDVRYRDKKLCAMTKEAYVEELGKLQAGLKEKSPEAEFVFVAPWCSTDGDPYCDMSYDEKTRMNEEYTEALRQYCADNGMIFVNANPYIRRALDKAPSEEYLLDHIHPNSMKGVVLYSEAALTWNGEE